MNGLGRPCNFNNLRVLFVQHCTVCGTDNIVRSNVIQSTGASTCI